MNVIRYDFTRPPPLAPNLRAKLAQWLGRSNTLLAELFAGMSVPVELRLDEITTLYPTEALAQWTDKTLAIQVKLTGRESQSVVALPNPLVQDLVTRLLGDSPEESLTERDLTPAEQSVAEFAVETIVRGLKESWQGESGIGLSVGETETNLRRTKRFRLTEPILVCRSSAKTSIGDSSWTWLLTNEFLAHLFDLPIRPQRPVDDHTSRRHLEELVRGMQSELEVRLGGVQLTGPELAALRVGDVVVLDQRVGEPLQASVRGEPKYLGWAGRVGNRQGFEIALGNPQARFGTDPSDAA
ncbi:MAG: FliM/FliN family flagellar motor switch protein [Planctomycetes bacterium]|nr:FliM/FliN family flagellar motor switch protein [Planctomycetota bacterium]